MRIHFISKESENGREIRKHIIWEIIPGMEGAHSQEEKTLQEIKFQSEHLQLRDILVGSENRKKSNV